MPRVAVIGAGIVGAASAFRLAEKGAEVVLLDRTRVVDGATAPSFGRVTAQGNLTRAYVALGEAALDEYRRLAWRLAPAPWYHADGTLVWFSDPERAAALQDQVQQLQAWGYAAEMLPAQAVLAGLEPGLAFPDATTPVAWFPQEAWVDAREMTRRLIDAARNVGARVLAGPGREVGAIATEAGRVSGVTILGGQAIPVSTVINAAGVDADRVAALVGRELAVKAPRSLAVRAEMDDGGDPLRRPLLTDHVAVRPDGPGRIFLVLAELVTTAPPGPLPLSDPLVAQTMRWAVAAVPALVAVRPVEAVVAAWPRFADDVPHVGPVPGIPGYVEAVTDYGVTLAPLIGRSLADELLGGAGNPLLAPFPPR
jgi:glycine/D-amino acid oxidase-like deaminating enzyme